MTEKNYQLQMWEIVKEKVRSHQSDVLYDVQVIARKGEDRQYLWVVRDMGTFIYPMPLDNIDATSVDYILKSYPREAFYYIIHPVKNNISSIEEEKVVDLLGIRRATIARKRMEGMCNDHEQLRMAIEGIEHWLDSGNYGQCPFNQVGWKGGCWLCIYYFEKGDGCPCVIYGIEAVKEKAKIILQNLKEERL